MHFSVFCFASGNITLFPNKFGLIFCFNKISESLINIIMNHSEKELKILEKIHQNEDSIRQRDLAKIAGLSLGMTNSILKRLAEKGYVTVKKVNNRNIKYAVSPLGIEEISKRSYKYFKRTIKNVVVYREAVEDVLNTVKEMGYSSVVLIGKSDIDFIIEHECMKKSLELIRQNNRGNDEDLFYLYSENKEPENSSDDNIIYLKKILIG